MNWRFGNDWMRCHHCPPGGSYFQQWSRYRRAASPICASSEYSSGTETPRNFPAPGVGAGECFSAAFCSDPSSTSRSWRQPERPGRRTRSAGVIEPRSSRRSANARPLAFLKDFPDAPEEGTRLTGHPRPQGWLLVEEGSGRRWVVNAFGQGRSIAPSDSADEVFASL